MDEWAIIGITGVMLRLLCIYMAMKEWIHSQFELTIVIIVITSNWKEIYIRTKKHLPVHFHVFAISAFNERIKGSRDFFLEAIDRELPTEIMLIMKPKSWTNFKKQ